MKELHFRLNDNFERPIITIKVNGRVLNILFDTGAIFPVWTLGASTLLDYFPSADCVKKKCKFSGFGGTVSGDVWRFPLDLGQGFIFPTMHAIVYKDTSMPNLIMGVGALKDMSTEVNYLDSLYRRIIFRIDDKDSFIRNLKFDNTSNGNRLILTTEKDVIPDIVADSKRS